MTSWNPVIFSNVYTAITFGNLDEIEINSPEDVPQEIYEAYKKYIQTLYNWYTDPSKLMLVLKIRGTTSAVLNPSIFSICINKLSYKIESGMKIFTSTFLIDIGVDMTVSPTRYYDYIGICRISIFKDALSILDFLDTEAPFFVYRKIYDTYTK